MAIIGEEFKGPRHRSLPLNQLSQEEIEEGIRKFRRLIRRFLQLLTVCGVLIVGLVVGLLVRAMLDGRVGKYSMLGFVATLVIAVVSASIAAYSVHRRQAQVEKKHEYMEMLSKANEEGSARYKKFF